MKKASALVVSLLFTATLCLWSQETESVDITPNNAPYIYESFSEQPLGLPNLASQVSQDYHNAPDEFAKQDYFVKLKPLLERKLAEAKAIPTYVTKFGSELGTYDFERQGFVTTINAKTIIIIGTGPYAVTFTNFADMAILPMSVEKARTFQTQLRDGRSVIFEVTIKPVGGAISSVGHTYYLLKGQVVAYRVLIGKNQQVLIEKKLP